MVRKEIWKKIDGIGLNTWWTGIGMGMEVARLHVAKLYKVDVSTVMEWERGDTHMGSFVVDIRTTVPTGNDWKEIKLP